MRPGEAAAVLSAGIQMWLRTRCCRSPYSLGEWPLLLKLANAMLRDRVHRAGESVERALDYVNRLLDRKGLVAFDARDPKQRKQAVSVTIEASLARLTETERARSAELAIFQEDANIPLDTLALFWARTGGLDAIDTERLLQALFNLSLLLELNLRDRHVRMHDVIRAYGHTRFTPLQEEALHRELVETYRAACEGTWANGLNDGSFYTIPVMAPYRSRGAVGRPRTPARRGLARSQAVPY